jgi:dihydrodipicolinate reductase
VAAAHQEQVAVVDGGGVVGKHAVLFWAAGRW